MLIEGQVYGFAIALTTGKPGFGAHDVPTYSGISLASIGPRSLTPPAAISRQSISVSSFSNRVEMRWTRQADPSGVGIVVPHLARNDGAGGPLNVALSGFNGTNFTDASVSANKTYQFEIQDVTFHQVVGPSTYFSVITPDVDSVDPRRVGVRPNGSYWGAMGENIDTLSGNVNFTLPLIKATTRGLSASFGLSYNSQMWRNDAGGDWLLGEDVGYVLGWRLMAGSVTPSRNGGWYGQIDHYLFTDATGAEYHLYDPNHTGVFSACPSPYITPKPICDVTYVTFDSNTNKLYFNDGTFWIMGAISGGIEQDSGTQYPTLIQDPNGNQIAISYLSGAGAGWANSSARISSITDVRAPSGKRTYNFSWGFTLASDAILHLDTIRNNIQTAESYNFYTESGRPLQSPFASQASFPNTTVLNLLDSAICNPATSSDCSTQPNYRHHFLYDPSGEMTQAVVPMGGHLRWDYGAFLYSNGRSLREVTNRYLSPDATGQIYGGTEWTYSLSRGPDVGNSNLHMHSYARISDPSTGNPAKVWNFDNGSADFRRLGLVTTYQEWQAITDANPLKQVNLTYGFDPSNKPYVAQKQTILNPNAAYSATSVESQVEDAYGNVTQSTTVDYVNTAATTRIYNNTYVTDGNYLSRYIRNRLATSTLTDGSGANAVTLVTNQYDSPNTCDATAPPYTDPTLPAHDRNYGTAVTVRGNLVYQQTPTGNRCSMYDVYGNVYKTLGPSGNSSSVAADGTSAAVPVSLTWGGDSHSITNLSWTAWQGVQSASGPNGIAYTAYDPYQRPLYTQTPFEYFPGLRSNYTYTANPPFQQTVTDSRGRWTRATLDGLGRTVKTETGTGQAATSVVDTTYGPCACSPTGKTVSVSQPYAPGGTVFLTRYTYDGSGRMLTSVAPDGASTTTYVYLGRSTTVNDPTGKWKQSSMDVFGNVVSVVEPDPANPVTGRYNTYYTYNDLGLPLTVSMPRPTGTQTRTFTYFAGTPLLKTETHPETGTTTYAYYGTDILNHPYDSRGYAKNLLWTKTDSMGQVTQFTYDGYGRATQVQRFPNGLGNGEDLCQQVNNTYDHFGVSPYFYWGKLVASAVGNATCTAVPQSKNGYFRQLFTYGTGGLPATKSLEYIGTNTGNNSPFDNLWTTSYSYDVKGNLSSTTYPGDMSGNPGEVYVTGYDAQSRPNSLTDTTNSYQLITGLNYNAAGQMTEIDFNSSGNRFNVTPFIEKRGYNALNQLTSIGVVNGQGAPIAGALSAAYTYSANQNNGQITGALAPYEQKAGSFGDRNIFYGVPESYVSEIRRSSPGRLGPVRPVPRPAPPGPGRGR